jgi:hypothetical protein
MNRRAAIRFCALAWVAGKLPATLDAAGLLTVDLGQWSSVVFKCDGESVTLTGREIFDALRKGKATT